MKDIWRKHAPELRALFNGAYPQFVLARKPQEITGVPVFCFHLVEAELFEADLDHLRRNGYHALSGQQFLQYLRGELDLPARSVLLTFDDGPRNFFEVAFPLLREYKLHALAFIAPGLHVDRAEETDVEARPMSWEEIGQIHASGLVQFQSHTFESRFVPDWPRPAELTGCSPAVEQARRRTPLRFGEDIARSRAVIEERLPGAKVTQLSFTQYLGTPSAVEEARALGFEACHWGLRAHRPLNCRGDSPYYISRLSDELLRRLPGAGRMSLRDLARLRIHRIRWAREWRRRHGGKPAFVSHSTGVSG